jgi:hypothetical protein
VNLLNGNEDHCSNNYSQDDGVISSVSLGLAVVKGRKKFHKATSHEARYKTALPFLEIRYLQKNKSTIKFGNMNIRRVTI